MSADRTAEKPADASRASHDFVPPKALIDFMAGGWIDRPAATGVHPQAERFRTRRELLGKSYPGDYLIVPAGRERVRANDTAYPFSAVERLRVPDRPRRTRRGPDPRARRRRASQRPVRRRRTTAARPNSSRTASTASFGSDGIAASKRARPFTAWTRAVRSSRRRVTSRSCATRSTRCASFVARRGHRPVFRSERIRRRTGRTSLRDAPDQGRVRARRAAPRMRRSRSSPSTT